MDAGQEARRSTGRSPERLRPYTPTRHNRRPWWESNKSLPAVRQRVTAAKLSSRLRHIKPNSTEMRVRPFGHGPKWAVRPPRLHAPRQTSRGSVALAEG